MEFDERSSGFPVALSAPGQSSLTEQGIASTLTSSLEPGMAVRIYAPGLTRTDVDSAVMVFSSHCSPRCTHAVTKRFAARLH